MYKTLEKAYLAERSKASDSRSDGRESAWVQIPQYAYILYFLQSLSLLFLNYFYLTKLNYLLQWLIIHR